MCNGRLTIVWFYLLSSARAANTNQRKELNLRPKRVPILNRGKFWFKVLSTFFVKMLLAAETSNINSSNQVEYLVMRKCFWLQLNGHIGQMLWNLWRENSPLNHATIFTCLTFQWKETSFSEPGTQLDLTNSTVQLKKHFWRRASIKRLLVFPGAWTSLKKRHT